MNICIMATKDIRSWHSGAALICACFDVKCFTQCLMDFNLFGKLEGNSRLEGFCLVRSGA